MQPLLPENGACVLCATGVESKQPQENKGRRNDHDAYTHSVSEFQTEAANAVFTKQQAISATLQLLTKEWNDPGNTPEEKSVLENAIQRAEFRYIDATKSETDRMLDAIGVARFTTQDIVNAIQAIVFDAE